MGGGRKGEEREKKGEKGKEREKKRRKRKEREKGREGARMVNSEQSTRTLQINTDFYFKSKPSCIHMEETYESYNIV
jgi:hypothetical protein